MVPGTVNGGNAAGDAMVEPVPEKIINEGGCDGFIPIETHAAAIVREKDVSAPVEEKYDSYVKYGKRPAQIIESIRLRK